MLHLFTTQASPSHMKNLQAEVSTQAGKVLKVTQATANKALSLAKTAKQQ
jgi:hypothetical protein